jgi:two-component system, NarL family, response regulator DevR
MVGMTGTGVAEPVAGRRDTRWRFCRQARPDRAGLIRVSVLEDHEYLRDVLTERLDGEPDMAVVGGCGSAAEAVRLIAALRPDVAVLDVYLPDGDGIAVCRQTRRLHNPPAVLMLTSSDDPELVHAARGAGAAGHLVKNLHGLDLAGAVRLVAQGRLVYDGPATQPPAAAGLGPPVRPIGP